MFYYLTRTQPTDGWYYNLMIIGVAAQFVAQWAAIVGCHTFAIASIALGIGIGYNTGPSFRADKMGLVEGEKCREIICYLVLISRVKKIWARSCVIWMF